MIIIPKDLERKQLDEYLYKNLAKHMATFLRLRSGSTNRIRANDACLNRFYPKDNKALLEESYYQQAAKLWRKGSSGRNKNQEAIHDTVGMFIAEKKNQITVWQSHGLIVESFTNKEEIAKTVINSLINYMIDQRRHEATRQQSFESSIICLEPEKLQPVTNIEENKMIQELEAKRREDEKLQELWETWARFTSTLTGEDLELTMHWFPTNTLEDRSMRKISQSMGITKRQVQTKIERLRSSFRAFLRETR